MKYNALQLLLKEEAEKYTQTLAFYELIKKDPEKAFMAEGTSGVVTPGFYKYFRKDWVWSKKKLTKDILINLKTIDDDKFKFFDKERRVNVIINRLSKILNNLGLLSRLVYSAFFDASSIPIKVEGAPMTLAVRDSILKIKTLVVKFEMEYEFNQPALGIIHILKKGDGYEILGGHHRLLAYLIHCYSMTKKVAEPYVMVGEYVGKD